MRQYRQADVRTGVRLGNPPAPAIHNGNDHGFGEPNYEVWSVNLTTQAAEYYANVLGFNFDWGNDEGGIAGISQGERRMFLPNAAFHQGYGTGGPVMIWLNLNSKAEVDELYHRWRAAGAKILAEPEDKPWRLRQFRVADLDGNQLRVFYDFAWELREQEA